MVIIGYVCCSIEGGREGGREQGRGRRECYYHPPTQQSVQVQFPNHPHSHRRLTHNMVIMSSPQDRNLVISVYSTTQYTIGYYIPTNTHKQNPYRPYSWQILIDTQKAHCSHIHVLRVKSN